MTMTGRAYDALAKALHDDTHQTPAGADAARTTTAAEKCHALIDAERTRQQAKMDRLIDACETALEYFEDREDIRDSDTGPKPNTEMSIAMALRTALGRAG